MTTNRENNIILSMITALFAENMCMSYIFLMTIWQRHKIRHFIIGVVKKCKQTSGVTSLPRVDRRSRPSQKNLKWSSGSKKSIYGLLQYLWNDPRCNTLNTELVTGSRGSRSYGSKRPKSSGQRKLERLRKSEGSSV